MDLHTSNQKVCLSASPPRVQEDLIMSLKPSTKPETCLIRGHQLVSLPSGSALGSEDAPASFLSTSCPSHQPPTYSSDLITVWTLPLPAPEEQPQPRFLRAGLWEELPSLALAAWTVPAWTCGPTRASLTHSCTLLSGRQTCKANLLPAVEARWIH